jgi:hypothetical protein
MAVQRFANVEVSLAVNEHAAALFSSLLSDKVFDELRLYS